MRPTEVGRTNLMTGFLRRLGACRLQVLPEEGGHAMRASTPHPLLVMLILASCPCSWAGNCS
jgi:hypothetical protein